MTFPRVKPLGWVDDEPLTADQVTEMDLNISILAGLVAVRAMTNQALNWPERSSAGSVSANNSQIAIAWAPNFGGVTGGLWCMIDSGGKTVYISPDGVVGGSSAWNAVATLSNLTPANPTVAYGQLDGVPAFMAIGASVGGHFYTSIDASTWTDHSIGAGVTPAFGIPLYIPGSNKWFSIGINVASCTATTAGITTWVHPTPAVPAGWTSATGSKRVIYDGNTTIVALPAASYNKCLVSTDSGNTWLEQILPFTATWTGLAYSTADQMWIAVNADQSDGAKSADGVTWTALSGANYTIATDLAVNGSLWIMTTVNANYGGIAWSVDKGATWTRGPSVGHHTIATAGWNRIVVGDGRFFVAHNDGTNIETAMSQRIG